MISKEYEEYERLTEGMEIRFSSLTFDFLTHCENIVFGGDYTDLKYFCYHFYNCKSLQAVYERFTFAMERVFKEIDAQQFPELNNGFSNLLIYLKEPSARNCDTEYVRANTSYWREIVISSDELRHHSLFRKYLY